MIKLIIFLSLSTWTVSPPVNSKTLSTLSEIYKKRELLRKNNIGLVSFWNLTNIVVKRERLKCYFFRLIYASIICLRSLICKTTLKLMSTTVANSNRTLLHVIQGRQLLLYLFLFCHSVEYRTGYLNEVYPKPQFYASTGPQVFSIRGFIWLDECGSTVSFRPSWHCSCE